MNVQSRKHTRHVCVLAVATGRGHRTSVSSRDSTGAFFLPRLMGRKIKRKLRQNQHVHQHVGMLVISGDLEIHSVPGSLPCCGFQPEKHALRLILSPTSGSGIAHN